MKLNTTANIWSDGQKSDTRPGMRISLHKKTKSNNYPKSSMVNRADIRWKEYVLNRRGLAGEAKKNRLAVTTNCEKSAEVIVPTNIDT